MSDAPLPTTVAIRASGIGKGYWSNRRKVEALREVSVDILAGTIVCVVGPSGCGKTTLLRILAGLEPDFSGSLVINSALREKGIAFVEQSGGLLPWRTLMQNVGLGLELRTRLDSDRIAYLRRLIDQFGLRGFEDSLADELSGGMQQRTALMRALASRPRLLFCDEPFSAIDFVSRLKLTTLFKSMCLTESVTTVFVTHNIEEAIFLAHRVVVLSGRPGRVVSQYSPRLTIGSEDAVKCREDPEFVRLFGKIWADLKSAYA